MTAVLNAIRRLDALLDRGDISPEEYARRRATLLNQIEDAQPDIIDITPVAPPAAPSPDTGRTGSAAAGLGLVVVFAVMGLCIGLTLLFLPNLNLALTLGVTILAALAVTLLRGSEQ